MSGKSKLTKDEKNDIIKARLNGERTTDLACKYGVSTATISETLRRNGVRILITKTCKTCGKEFRASNVIQLYCTRECKNVANGMQNYPSQQKKYYKKRQSKSELTGWVIPSEDPNKRLTQKCIRAKELGMSYGQYVRYMECGKV